MRDARDTTQDTTRHRVLVVDDEESTRLLLARMLSQSLDAEVQLAGTCEQALRSPRLTSTTRSCSTC